MSERELQPEVIVFAGPNGSGKSTITKLAKTVGIYISMRTILNVQRATERGSFLVAEFGYVKDDENQQQGVTLKLLHEQSLNPRISEWPMPGTDTPWLYPDASGYN